MGALTTSRLSAPARAVALEVLVHGARSRAQLATRLGLSAATLTRVVKPLLAAGLLEESDAVRSPGRGRSSLPLDVVPERHRFVGVRLTEDSVYAVVTDLRAQVLDEEVVALECRQVADAVTAVARIVAALRARGDVVVDAVGVTLGGQVEDEEVVAGSPFPDWHEIPLRALLSEALAAPVHLDNEVVGLTRAQHWFGHARGCENFALLTIGAGIGYALVLEDRLVPLPVHPVSHFPVDPAGPVCALGHRGCATAYLAAASIVTATSVGHGRPMTYQEVLDLAGADDPIARRVVREAARALGRTAAAIASLTGVERVILSGEGVHLADVAGASLDDGLHDHDGLRHPHARPVVRPMDVVEWARGAAAVAIHAEFPDRLYLAGMRRAP